ncbi:hypothetical protein SADUNF_Sadunf03G0119100 [Salix dunnii]|uniref:Uncharacterized protein n=1 Tax=Salix dunnii TaxID=1413687 RepID=A0A835N4E7_9ROSI|nr:hypothetical protein SADUNF_Sadunf03G0119100 [Salix dunnii]
MVLSATVIGALLGLGTQMYSNALRKLPYMRHPWEHVVGMGLGVVFVNQLVKWDAQLEQDLDKMLQKAKEANERRYFGTLSFSYLDHIFLFQQFFFSGSLNVFFPNVVENWGVFDSVDGNVKLVKLEETDFYLLLPRIEIKMMISASGSL